MAPFTHPLAASLKLNSITAGPQVGRFLDEVISDPQTFSGVEIEMTLVVYVRDPVRIEKAFVRIVLKNSDVLKVEKPGLY